MLEIVFYRHRLLTLKVMLFKGEKRPFFGKELYRKAPTRYYYLKESSLLVECLPREERIVGCLRSRWGGDR